jgi:hypothetical protein
MGPRKDQIPKEKTMTIDTDSVDQELVDTTLQHAQDAYNLDSATAGVLVGEVIDGIENSEFVTVDAVTDAVLDSARQAGYDELDATDFVRAMIRRLT